LGAVSVSAFEMGFSVGVDWCRLVWVGAFWRCKRLCRVALPMSMDKSVVPLCRPPLTSHARFGALFESKQSNSRRKNYPATQKEELSK
jgi:hypothetical protein